MGTKNPTPPLCQTCGKEPGDMIGNHVICRRCNQATIARMNKLDKRNQQRDAISRSAEKLARELARKQRKASDAGRENVRKVIEKVANSDSDASDSEASDSETSSDPEFMGVTTPQGNMQLAYDPSQPTIMEAFGNTPTKSPKRTETPSPAATKATRSADPKHRSKKKKANRQSSRTKSMLPKNVYRD